MQKVNELMESGVAFWGQREGNRDACRAALSKIEVQAPIGKIMHMLLLQYGIIGHIRICILPAPYFRTCLRCECRGNVFERKRRRVGFEWSHVETRLSGLHVWMLRPSIQYGYGIDSIDIIPCLFLCRHTSI